MKQHAILFGIALLLLSACADDEEPRISQLNATTVNPDVHLYIEDFDEGDLLAAGLPVSVRLEETYEELPFTIAADHPLPWGGRGTLLTLTPGGPYHYLLDNEYTYTLDPTTLITVGQQQLRLRRWFDYDLRRRDLGNGAMSVDVDYTVVRTALDGSSVTGDTLHVIMENGYAYLRTEGQPLTLEMRLPAVSDSLAALPLEQDDEGIWHAGDLLQFRLLFSGRSIARPYEHLSLSNRTERTQDGSGAWIDDRFLSLQVSLRLPYISDGTAYYHLTNGSFSYLLTSPALLGDEYEQSVDVEVYGYENQESLTLTGLHINGVWVNADDEDPEHIVVDWRKILTYEE